MRYEKVSILIGAVCLFVSSAFIVRGVAEFARNFPERLIARPARPALPLRQRVEVQQALERLRAPAQWIFNGRSGLFVPEKHFIDVNGFPATLQTTEVHPPVPNAWIEEFGLPLTEADVLGQDPDADGFTNFEEWQNQTRPTDKSSHPPFVAKLKMKSFVQEPFRLVFASWVDDTFAINTNDLKEPTQFLKLGASIRGTKFRLHRFSEKFETNRYGTRIDISELTLMNLETSEEVNLVKEKIMISPESVAHLVYAWGGNREFSVRKDQEFSLKPEEQIKYKLVDVQATKALIINIREPDQLIEVGLLPP